MKLPTTVPITLPMTLRHLAQAIILASAALALAASAKPGDSKVITSKTGKLQVTTIAEGLQNPWGIAFLPNGDMLVTERSGSMRIVSANGTLGAPIANVPKVAAQGQGGLLDVVLAPDFASSQKIYFSYAEPGDASKGESGNSTAVSSAVLKDNALHQVTRLFSQQPKVASSAHFGSRLIWAPDGTLFITLGDRWSEKDRAQTLDNHQGKVVRINADGSIPADNPFVKTPGALPEIWSYGHRNVQGGAIHPVSKALWTGEHGPQGGDELNLTQAGKNYGWPVITYGENYGGGKIGEGTHKAGMEQPVYKWVPSIATAGFIFYTGDQFPQWKNNILLTSLREQTLVRLQLEGDKVVSEERLLKKEIGERLRHIAQGPDGLVYIISDESNGKIFRLSPHADKQP